MNDTYFELFTEFFYQRIGSASILHDDLYLYVLAPYSILGILLNLSCLIAFRSDKTKFQSPIYKYYNNYILIGIGLCSIELFHATNQIPRYTRHAYSYSSRIFECIFVFALTATLYFYNNFIYLLIMIERICMFTLKFRTFSNLISSRISILVLFICAIINIPSYFIYTTPNQIEFDKFNKNETVLCVRTSFGESNYSKLIMVIIITINNFLTFILELILYRLSQIYYRQFIDNRMMLRKINERDRDRTVSVINLNGDRVDVRLNNVKRVSNWNGLTPIYTLSTNLTQLVLSYILVTSSSQTNLSYQTLKLILDFIFIFRSSNVAIHLYLFDSNFRHSFNKLFF